MASSGTISPSNVRASAAANWNVPTARWASTRAVRIGLAASAAMIRANSSSRARRDAAAAVEDLGPLPTGQRRRASAADGAGDGAVDVGGGAQRGAADLVSVVRRRHDGRLVVVKRSPASGTVGRRRCSHASGVCPSLVPVRWPPVPESRATSGRSGGQNARVTSAIRTSTGPGRSPSPIAAARSDAPENTMRGLRARRRARLPLPRDRRPGDRRRRARRVPRRRPAAARADDPGGSTSCRGRRWPRRGSAGTEPIPTFDELLDAWPDVRINVDCKSDGAVAPLRRRRSSATAPSTGSASRRSATAACAPHPLARRSALCTALAPGGSWPCCGRSGLRLGGSPPRCRRGGARSRWSPSASSRRAHRHGMPVHVWTIDDRGRDGPAARPRRRRDHHRPAGVLRDVLVERGQWPP